MELWTYSTTTTDTSRNLDLTGFDVEARDGGIGKIDDASYEAGNSCIVVDTGFWIFGKKRMLPAGVIERIDTDDRKVYVRMTKDQIKDAPDYDETMHRDDTYRERVGSYYGRY
jgi:hypothetical protein